MSARRPIYLVLAGGGALGSYIAGALTAIYDVLDHLEHTGASDFEIRGIVGASAGGLSGAMFARALVTQDRTKLDELRDAWIEVFTIESLMAVPPRKVPSLGLFYAEGIVTRFRQILTHGPLNEPWKGFAGRKLRLAFAIANPYGIPYLVPVTRGRPVPLIRPHESLEYELERDYPDVGELWGKIGMELPATSATPLLYPPREVGRTPADYPHSELPDDEPFVTLNFVDGGTLSNEPFDLALEMIAQEGIGKREPILLLIDPGTPLYAGPVREPPFIGFVGRCLQTAISESMSVDWIEFRHGRPRVRTDLDVWAVHPSEPLPGSFWGSFGSLFKREWREFSFRSGEFDALEVLHDAGLIPPLDYSARPKRPVSGPGCVPRRRKLGVVIFMIRRAWILLGSGAKVLTAALIFFLLMGIAFIAIELGPELTALLKLLGSWALAAGRWLLALVR